MAKDRLRPATNDSNEVETLFIGTFRTNATERRGTPCGDLRKTTVGVRWRSLRQADVADSGLENVNGEVDSLCGLGQLRRVLAQVEVTFSNSMLEARWRSLKHGWLYLHALDTVAALEGLIRFYVEQHNTVIPHAAFAGQTPDEMYFGRGDLVPGNLAAAHARARSARLAANRASNCNSCRAADGAGEGT
jgi:putative transposase